MEIEVFLFAANGKRRAVFSNLLDLIHFYVMTFEVDRKQER